MCVAIAAVISVLWQPAAIQELMPAPSVAEPGKQASALPEGFVQPPRYPVEPVAAALPPLDASDEVVLNSMQALWTNGGTIGSYLTPTNLVRNFVVTVDNAPRRTWAVQRFPFKPPQGAFTVSASGDTMVGNPSNALRYSPYVEMLDTADSKKLVSLYVRNYPLFQQAYRDLGYPSGHFNDRLVEAIDVMIATPELAETPKLAQPKVFFQFADRDLEQLPAGQKLMLRMGPEHAKTVKAKLIDIRRILTAQAPTAAAAAPPGPR